MTHDGTGPCLILTGSKSAAAVYEVYVRQAQIPILRLRQVVVVNSLLSHKGERGVHELLERWGCNVLYLLPYSLDLNPVEEAVFKVKGALRRAGARTLKALVGAMNWALDAVAARDARAFLEHCGNRLWVPSL
jgi:transposase